DGAPPEGQGGREKRGRKAGQSGEGKGRGRGETGRLAVCRRKSVAAAGDRHPAPRGCAAAVSGHPAAAARRSLMAPIAVFKKKKSELFLNVPIPRRSDSLKTTPSVSFHVRVNSTS